MKRKYLSAFLFCSIICSIATAQSLKSWTWSTYKMKFSIPDNMKVSINTADKFEATNSVMAIDIYPRKGENLTYSGMKASIIDWASRTGLRYMDNNVNGDAQPIYLKDLNGYWGCAIDGKKNGAPTSILLLVDPDFPDLSFYVWLSYTDDYYQDAVQVLKSFEPI